MVGIFVEVVGNVCVEVYKKLYKKRIFVEVYENQRENWRKTSSFRCSLLSHELTDQQRLLTQTRSELIKQHSEFCSQFGVITAWKINSFLLNCMRNEDEKLNWRHISKLRALGLSSDLEEPMVVRNFPNKILNSTQLHLLNQGLNHSIFPKKLNLADVQAEFELLYQQSRGYFTVEQRLKLKQTLMSLFAKYFLTFFHERMTNIHALSLTELNSLKKLAKDPNIIVSKFDKGNGVAILNTSDYKEKMLKILNDRTKFVPVGKDDNLQKLDQFQRCIRYLKGKGAITSEDYQRIYLTSAAHQLCMGYQRYIKMEYPSDQFWLPLGHSIMSVPNGFRISSAHCAPIQQI